MATMDRQIAVFDKDGRISLPPNLAEDLGIEMGSEYEVTIEHDHIHLRPILPIPSGTEFDETAIDQLRAMLRGGPSLEDELLASRHEEEAHQLQKEREWL